LSISRLKAVPKVCKEREASVVLRELEDTVVVPALLDARELVEILVFKALMDTQDLLENEVFPVFSESKEAREILVRRDLEDLSDCLVSPEHVAHLDLKANLVFVDWMVPLELPESLLRELKALEEHPVSKELLDLKDLKEVLALLELSELLVLADLTELLDPLELSELVDVLALSPFNFPTVLKKNPLNNVFPELSPNSGIFPATPTTSTLPGENRMLDSSTTQPLSVLVHLKLSTFLITVWNCLLFVTREFSTLLVPVCTTSGLPLMMVPSFSLMESTLSTMTVCTELNGLVLDLPNLPRELIVTNSISSKTMEEDLSTWIGKDPDSTVNVCPFSNLRLQNSMPRWLALWPSLDKTFVSGLSIAKFLPWEDCLTATLLLLCAALILSSTLVIATVLELVSSSVLLLNTLERSGLLLLDVITFGPCLMMDLKCTLMVPWL